MLPFPSTRPNLAFSDLNTDSTIFCYSSGMFFGTHPNSTFSRYSPGFYLFQLLTLILPFFGTRRHSFSILARILPFPGTFSDFTFFRSWHWFYHFSVLVGTVFRYSHGFYLFPVLARILPFSGRDTDSTICRKSSGQFFGTGTNSNFSRY